MGIFENCNVVHHLCDLTQQILSDESLKNTCLADLVSSYKLFVSSFCQVAENLTSNPTSWQFVNDVLIHFTILQRTAKLHLYIRDEQYLMKVCVNIISCDSTWSTLLQLTQLPEKIIQYTAQKTISCIVTELCKQQDLQRLTNDLIKLIIISEAESRLLSIIGIVTMLLKQLGIEQVDIPDSLFLMIGDKLEAFMQSKPDPSNKKMYLQYLSFYRALIDTVELPECMSALLLQSYPILLEVFHLKSAKAHCRLMHLQILKDLLPFPPVQDANSLVVDASELYVRTFCDQHQLLHDLFCSEPEFVGFAGRIVKGQTSDANAIEMFSKPEKMSLLNGFLRAVCVSCKESGSKTDLTEAENALVVLLNPTLLEKFCVEECILDIYFEQDDAMIEMLLLLLTIRISLASCPPSDKPGCKNDFVANPHSLFVELLQRLAFDSSVLLDWLMSNETQFLLYFLKYLKYTATTFKEFHSISNSLSSSEANESLFYLTMSLLQRLRYSIEKLCSKSLFPYPVKPLLKKIIDLETLAKNV